MSVASTLVRGAEIRFREAPESIRSLVGCFWTITAEQDAVLQLVPDGSTTISTELRDGGIPAWSLRGPLLKPDARRFAAAATVVGIRLRPGVAFILTGVPTDTLVDRRLDLAGVSAFKDLGAVEPRPRTAAEHMASLERFLVARLQHAAIHPVVAAVLADLERERGSVTASELASRSGVSAKHLNRLMRRWVGYGCKRLTTIVRFQATLHGMEQSAERPVASLAIEHGYFDQSHMTHDAVRLSGATPGNLVLRAKADFPKTLCDDLL
jgi:AraC-like DNA-binding protein